MIRYNEHTWLAALKTDHYATSLPECVCVCVCVCV